MSCFFDAPFFISDEEEQKRHALADAQAATLFAGQTPWAARARVTEIKLRAAFATTGPFPDAISALRRLIYGRGTAWLATLDPIFADWGPQAGNTGLDALLQFALLSPFWMQAPEDWQPPAPATLPNRPAALGDLARFLFCRYPLPAFFDRVWLGGFDPVAQTFRQAFVHLGQGGKLEAVPFSAPMSHRAAHYFLTAPNDFTLPAALRWGQIKALNGSERIACALRDTFLQNAQADEAFWFTFTQFLINHPEIPLWQVGALADYVQFRKFGGQTSDDGEAGDGAEPNFSLKGRTSNALLYGMTEWHDALGRAGKKRATAWPASQTIAPLDETRPDSCSPLLCRWRIRELTQSTDLLQEGQAMRHCVRTYQAACEKGQTSLWSLRIALFDAHAPKPVSQRLLTIEINNGRRAIVQVRGKCNQLLPTLRVRHKRMADAHAVLREWAARERLGIACSL